MTRLPDLILFSKLASGAMKAITTRVLEQDVVHRSSFEVWAYKTQFARVFEAGSATL